jgi:drug/metabolite transporter (DMT)-like permease
MSNTVLRRDYVGMTLVILSAFGFALKAIWVKLAYPLGIDAISLLALRMLFASPFFLLLLWHSNRSALKNKPKIFWAQLILAGGIGYYGASLFDFLGLQYISASLERMVLMLYPTFTVLLGAWLLKEVLTLRVMGILLFCYIGLMLIVLPEGWLVQDWATLGLGAGLVLLSTLCYSFYLVLSGSLLKQLPSQTFTSMVMLISAAFVGVQFSVSHSVYPLLHYSPMIYAYAFCMAIVSTVLPSLLITAGMKRIGSSQAAVISSIGPVLTLILGFFVLGERLVWLQIIGCVMVVLGVTQVGKQAKKSG